MGLAEIGYRVRNKTHATLEKHGFGLANCPTAPVGNTGKSWLTVISRDFEVGEYTDAADRILDGRFGIFALRDVNLGFPPQWNRDSKTGTMAPMVFGKTLDYRDESLVGDIKYLWEPNRHLELVTLAQAWHLTGESKYSEGCRTLLLSWFDQCSYPLGPNWVSSLEHSVRLVNWSFAWHLLGGADSELFHEPDGEEFRHRWLDTIYQHCHFISGHFSLYSSANNHLLGEYMGLFVATTTWPLWEESLGWQELAQSGFQKEALMQNAVDGVNLEQGIWYHHEVADMMLLCALVGKSNGIDFPVPFWNRLEKMMDFIASLMDVDGNIPMFGDSDDAVMVRFSPNSGHDVYRSLLATGSVLFDRAEYKKKAVSFDDKSKWLLGEKGKKKFDSLLYSDHLKALPRAFPDGGYYIFGENLDKPEEIRVVADAGQLGYLSIAAHGHADALSFTLSIAGQEMLVDPGTYAYHTQKKWRDYFRGTSAHNTVRIDSLDQSVPGGNFLWIKHAKARCINFESNQDTDILIAEHDGYLRLKDPVKHIRSIVFDKKKQIITVTDKLEARKEHFTELYWHLSENCNVQQSGNAIIVSLNDTKLSMKLLNSEWFPEVIKGSDNPPLGWISRRFDQKTPAYCLRWSGDINGATELVTEIKFEN